MSEIELSVKELRRRQGALSVLANRFAPTIRADMRIAQYMSVTTRALEPFEKLRSKVFMRIVEAEGITTKDAEKMTGFAQQLLHAKISAEQDEAEQETVKLEVPTFKLSQDDLPKERSGDEGWKNGAQLAAIVSDLGDFFEFAKE